MRHIAVVAAAGLAVAACSGHAEHASTTAAPSAHGHHSAAPVEPVMAARHGERIVTVGVPEGFTPQAPTGATDEYRCFVVDPGLQQGVSITGAEFVPGNPAIVHHSILYAALPSQLDAARALDAEDAEPGYECFGGSRLPSRGNALQGLEESDWITAWAPGGKPTEMPDGYGMPLPAGSGIVIQMHYNLAEQQGADSTQVRLRVSDHTLRPLTTTLLPAPVELPCAPGETGRLCNREDAVDDVVSRFGAGSGATIAGLQLLCGGDPSHPKAGNVQTCDRPVTEAARVFAVAGHMHLLGREISVTLNPGTPQAKVLLDIPNWDFDQQSAIPLKNPVDIKPGDTLRVRCRHDASLRAQLPALQNTPARYVVWGEGTADEMCLAIVVRSAA
ncbi:MAG: hypothetical protein V9G10_18275 [Candidatus Nanopelagicales bacterium]